jgi:hypothetical protein
MALIQCQECSGKVSTKAVACPHCGAPVETVDSTEIDDASSTSSVIAESTVIEAEIVDSVVRTQPFPMTDAQPKATGFGPSKVNPSGVAIDKSKSTLDTSSWPSITGPIMCIQIAFAILLIGIVLCTMCFFERHRPQSTFGFFSRYSTGDKKLAFFSGCSFAASIPLAAIGNLLILKLPKEAKFRVYAMWAGIVGIAAAALCLWFFSSLRSARYYDEQFAIIRVAYLTLVPMASFTYLLFSRFASKLSTSLQNQKAATKIDMATIAVVLAPAIPLLPWAVPAFNLEQQFRPLYVLVFSIVVAFGTMCFMRFTHLASDTSVGIASTIYDKRRKRFEEASSFENVE